VSSAGRKAFGERREAAKRRGMAAASKCRAAEGTMMDQGAVGSQEELRDLLAAARGMAEGNFHHVINIRARGLVGELAAYINQTLKSLQHLDPAVRGSSREIPKVAKQLAEIIKTTEDATNRVLEETEQMLAEQGKIEESLVRTAAMLAEVLPAKPTAEWADAMAEAQRLHSQAQNRAMEIMAAMEFQDLTTQKIQRLTVLVGDIESRLVQLLALFRLDEVGPSEGCSDPILVTCAANESAQFSQDLVDQLLGEFTPKRLAG
jgi:chemotaxis protein CheZ